MVFRGVPPRGGYMGGPISHPRLQRLARIVWAKILVAKIFHFSGRVVVAKIIRNWVCQEAGAKFVQLFLQQIFPRKFSRGSTACHQDCVQKFFFQKIPASGKAFCIAFRTRRRVLCSKSGCAAMYSSTDLKLVLGMITTLATQSSADPNRLPDNCSPRSGSRKQIQGVPDLL